MSSPFHRRRFTKLFSLIRCHPILHGHAVARCIHRSCPVDAEKLHGGSIPCNVRRTGLDRFMIMRDLEVRMAAKS